MCIIIYKGYLPHHCQEYVGQEGIYRAVLKFQTPTTFQMPICLCFKQFKCFERFLFNLEKQTSESDSNCTEVWN